MKTARGLLLAAAWLIGQAGCVTLDLWHHKDVPAPGTACQVHTTWENRIVVAADSVNQGASLPGLAGRLYLFGEELGHPVVGDGKLVVDLFDAVHLGADGQPRLLERFELDRDTLKRLLRKDLVGWGYTLFLPWSTWQPDISRVHLKVTYIPAKGAPLYAPKAMLTLRQDANPIVVREEKVAPVTDNARK